MTHSPWPHQIRAWNEIRKAVEAGRKKILLTLPTGGGKTYVFTEEAKRWAAEEKRVGIFANRKLLVAQADRAFGSEWHGVISAGHREESVHRIQICSMQTLDSRVRRRETMEMPPFDLYVIDEAHSNKAGAGQTVMEHCKGRNAFLLGVTATPVGLGAYYDHLIVAGTTSELRACGALVPCDVYAPDEPDMTGVRKIHGEYAEGEMRKRFRETVVFGNVFEHWARINQWGGKYTLVFAPGVEESLWIRDEFRKQGVTCEHMDGSTSEGERDSILAASKSGECKVVTSCGVLREGADLPWVRHGVLLQPCGGLTLYLQIVGRLLRSYPGKERAVLQEHAGAFHRHGSPNIDREWSLEDTDVSLAKAHKQRVERGLEPEGIVCPKCRAVRKGGPACPFCGHQHTRSVRLIRMTNGELRKQIGSVVKKSSDSKIWTSCLFAAGMRGMTIAQAAGMYRAKTGTPLPQDKYPEDRTAWSLRVRDVYPWTVNKLLGKYFR